MLDTLLAPLRSLIGMQSINPNAPVLDQATLRERLDAGQSMIVLFYADWCGFCRAFTPTFEDHLDDLPLPPAAANISDHDDPRWDTFNVANVPTLIAFVDGEETARADGRPGQGLHLADLERLVDQLPP